MIHNLARRSPRGVQRPLAAISAAILGLTIVSVGSPAQATPSATPTQVQSYVTAVYSTLFNRAPDATGLTGWTSALLSGTPRAAVANAITSSDEYRGHLIAAAYQQYLGRTPEPAGAQFWLAYLGSGQTLQQMESGFFAADEYYLQAGQTSTGWVNRLYGNILGRAASPAEVSGWVSVLASGGSRGQVAMGFLMSTEHLLTVVNGYYVDILGRALDSSGADTWVRALQSGSRVEEIIGSLVSSAEYGDAHGSPVAVSPGSATVVTPGSQLAVHDGDLTITTPGTVLDRVEVRGYLRVRAANVTVKNSIIRGRAGLTGSMALVQSNSPGLQIIDTEIAAAYPTWGVDGFVGSSATFTRVNIHGVVDSIKLTGGNVVIQDSWLHDNLYYATTPSGHDTHSDNLQIQAGSNITVRNNDITSSRNAAVMITQDTGAVSNFSFTGNRADHGACTINIAEKTFGPLQNLVITDNVFGTGTKVDHCAVLAPTTTSSVSNISNNTFTDGTPFKVNRG